MSVMRWHQVIGPIMVNSVEFITHCISPVRISQCLVHDGENMRSIEVCGDGLGVSGIRLLYVVFTTGGHGMVIVHEWIRVCGGRIQVYVWIR